MHILLRAKDNYLIPLKYTKITDSHLQLLTVIFYALHNNFFFYIILVFTSFGESAYYFFK